MTNKERLIELSIKYNLSHIGSCFTALGIIEAIYAIKKPEDKFVLSSGHAHLAHAVVLEQIGKSIEEPIKDIHCNRESGCDVSTGSLGQGLAISVGLALANRDKTIFCLVSDGEMAEGSNWEALRIAEEQKLSNLRVFVNANGYGAYKEIDTEDLIKKLDAWVPALMVVDDNNPFTHALALGRERNGPVVTIYKTNPKLGIWAEGLAAHYKPADKELYDKN